MAKRTCRTHTASFKAKVTFAAITGKKTQAELAQLSAARGGGMMIAAQCAHPAIESIIFIRGGYAFHFRRHLDPSRRSYVESRPQRSAGVATCSE
jgi:hypothetical protein